MPRVIDRLPTSGQLQSDPWHDTMDFPPGSALSAILHRKMPLPFRSIPSKGELR